MEFEPMLTPREKSPLPENVPRGVSGTFSGRGDFSLGVNMGSNSIPLKLLRMRALWMIVILLFHDDLCELYSSAKKTYADKCLHLDENQPQKISMFI